MADARATLAQEILDLAKELGALAFGEFVLTSGQTSAYYFRRPPLDALPEGGGPRRQGAPARRARGGSGGGRRARGGCRSPW